MRSVCVFCGSSLGRSPAYADAARGLGALLAELDLALIYGGAHVGLMGVVADAVLKAGGKAVGVIPRAMVDREVAHTGLSELHVVDSMHERKALMAKLSGAFIGLPGGFGTFEELCEILTWAQLGLHEKPVGVLNIGGYYDPLLALFDMAVKEGFVRQEHHGLLLQGEEPRELLERFRTYRAPQVTKWLEPEDT